MPASGTNSRARIEEVFQKHLPGTELNITIEASTKELVIKYVGMNFGVAIVPVSPNFRAYAAANSRTQFQDASHLFGLETIAMLRRHHKHEPEQQLLFRSAVLSHFAERPQVRQPSSIARLES